MIILKIIVKIKIIQYTILFFLLKLVHKNWEIRQNLIQINQYKILKKIKKTKEIKKIRNIWIVVYKFQNYHLNKW